MTSGEESILPFLEHTHPASLVSTSRCVLSPRTTCGCAWVSSSPGRSFVPSVRITARAGGQSGNGSFVTASVLSRRSASPPLNWNGLSGRRAGLLPCLGGQVLQKNLPSLPLVGSRARHRTRRRSTSASSSRSVSGPSAGVIGSPPRPGRCSAYSTYRHVRRPSSPFLPAS